MSNPHETWWKKLTYEAITIPKFHENCAKIVDLLLIAKFWMCADFFYSDLTICLWRFWRSPTQYSTLPENLTPFVPFFFILKKKKSSVPFWHLIELCLFIFCVHTYSCLLTWNSYTHICTFNYLQGSRCLFKDAWTLVLKYKGQLLYLLAILYTLQSRKKMLPIQYWNTILYFYDTDVKRVPLVLW